MRAKKLVESVMQVLKRSFPDLSVLKPISDTSIDGIAGAEVTTEYRQPLMKDAPPSRSRIIVIPRGGFAISMTFTDAPKAAEDCSSLFDEVLKTVKIAK